MSTRALLAGAAQRLADAGLPSPEPDAEWLLAHVLGRGRAGLAFAPVTEEQRQSFEALLSRRAAGEPLQHIVGTAAFRHVELAVGPGVFIPRPETELLAGWGIERLRALRAAGRPHPVVVDLCTGSGAIAKAVADEAPWAVVHAVELSEEALAYAERNLESTGVDLRAGDAADAFPDLDGGVDLVLANPPYIPVGEYESVAREVREHDPPIALWSGEDGLDTVRVVERTAARLLRAGGEVGCEHADSQGERVPAVFVRAGGWRDVRDHADLAGRPRFTTARRA
uniref:Release factor glutamine methyltransferase n=1 Tax=uncultured Nocardioidaceae bacterium TaxID=253824 RepID=A0A6J4L5E3_9ACTN|nr:MAG: Peptide chain release factor N(5)-glutamine methyltransferase [uncultured Nocardioidaceae bacterium]